MDHNPLCPRPVFRYSHKVASIFFDQDDPFGEIIRHDSESTPKTVWYDELNLVRIGLATEANAQDGGKCQNPSHGLSPFSARHFVTSTYANRTNQSRLTLGSGANWVGGTVAFNETPCFHAFNSMGSCSIFTAKMKSFSVKPPTA